MADPYAMSTITFPVALGGWRHPTHAERLRDNILIQVQFVLSCNGCGVFPCSRVHARGTLLLVIRVMSGEGYVLGLRFPFRFLLFPISRGYCTMEDQDDGDTLRSSHSYLTVEKAFGQHATAPFTSLRARSVRLLRKMCSASFKKQKNLGFMPSYGWFPRKAPLAHHPNSTLCHANPGRPRTHG